MVSESVCLAEMIILDMFQTQLMERKSFGNFPDEFSREPSRKTAQNSKNGQNQAFFGFTESFLPF